MKKLFILMLGLVAGTASFAKTTTNEAPAAAISITSDNKLKLVIAPEVAKATVALHDQAGHLLYTESIDLRQGVTQRFVLDELSTGTYRVDVKVGDINTVKTFVVQERPAETFVMLES
ncbi:T9SS C-terminal target domain-containing protein [Spirosoma gilvum]